MTSEYFELAQLIGIYFSQDYEEEGVEQQVRQYLADRGRHSAELHAELVELIARDLDESATERLLDNYGCAIYPPSEDGTYVEFVRHLLRALDALAPSSGG